MPTSESRHAAFALAVLTFINLFNYLDRWVLSAVIESIRDEFHFSDTQLGWLAAGFIIVYMLTSPVFGSLGDRLKRPPLIALGVAIWSVATTLAGFARGFGSMFTARATVGVGEAAYGTIAPALLADHFPLEKRGRVFAVFFAAIPLGSAAGYVVGGFVDKHFGWRTAFWVAGAPGLIVALLVLLVREVQRGQHDAPEVRAHDVKRSVMQSYLDLFRNRPFILACLGYAAWTFAIGGLGVWTPSFLIRARGWTKDAAAVTFGGIVLITGFIGTFAGGWIADYLLKWTKQSYLWVCGIATLLAAPAAFVAFTNTSKPVYMTAIVIAEILAFASTGPVNSAIVNVVAPSERASAVALSIFIMHLLGDVPSPPLIGILSDMSSLAQAFLIVPVAIFISGAIWTYAATRK